MKEAEYFSVMFVSNWLKCCSNSNGQKIHKIPFFESIPDRWHQCPQIRFKNYLQTVQVRPVYNFCGLTSRSESIIFKRNNPSLESSFGLLKQATKARSEEGCLVLLGQFCFWAFSWWFCGAQTWRVTLVAMHGVDEFGKKLDDSTICIIL